MSACTTGKSPAEQPVAAAASGEAQWWCIADLGIDHGICAPEKKTCREWRGRASQGRLNVSECEPQPRAWCFDKPKAGSAAAYDTCQPTASDCGIARREFVEENPQPPLNCQEYPVPG